MTSSRVLWAEPRLLHEDEATLPISHRWYFLLYLLNQYFSLKRFSWFPYFPNYEFSKNVEFSGPIFSANGIWNSVLMVMGSFTKNPLPSFLKFLINCVHVSGRVQHFIPSRFSPWLGSPLMDSVCGSVNEFRGRGRVSGHFVWITAAVWKGGKGGSKSGGGGRVRNVHTVSHGGDEYG